VNLFIVTSISELLSESQLLTTRQVGGLYYLRQMALQFVKLLRRDLPRPGVLGTPLDVRRPGLGAISIKPSLLLCLARANEAVAKTGPGDSFDDVGDVFVHCYKYIGTVNARQSINPSTGHYPLMPPHCHIGTGLLELRHCG